MSNIETSEQMRKHTETGFSEQGKNKNYAENSVQIFFQL